MTRIKEIEGEEWKDIQGYEGLYMISNMGRVKSLPKICLTPSTEYLRGELIMTGVPNKKGYLALVLTKGGKKYPKRIHRLVAEAFISNPENLPQVNHVKGIKIDNRASQLEWITNLDNMRHSFAMGRKMPKGCENVNSKVVLNTQTGIFYDTMTEAAHSIGISFKLLSRKLLGERRNNTSMIYV